MPRSIRNKCLFACTGVLLALCAAGDDLNGAPDWPTSELHFTRMYYQGNAYDRGWRGGSWTTDYPEAEEHFTRGVGRLTRVDVGQARMLKLGDDTIFNYPWLYAVEVGRWYLDETEAGRLREYLLRGGFLMVDDFHGTRQWASFMDSMQRVFPDRPVVEISDRDEVFHVLYDLDQRIQIPGIAALARGVTYEQDGVQPHWRGIYDDTGRLMVAINFNMDLGDAWEHADNPYYPEAMTTLAYRFAVNYVVYAMTH
ncbi:MAG TPA: DUF4159 domain-containing protein [Gammaproteobacteria bacterium]|jgi:hypothetical protein|nr:DUF4159 domain-containing protein [Gammaproteobacteria bacterium]